MRASTLAIIAAMGAGGGGPVIPGLGPSSPRWRILIDEAADWQYIAIQEIEMAAAPAGANQCTGGTITFGAQRASFPATDAFDGNKVSTSHGWGIDRSADPDATDWWVEYNFGTDVKVGELRMWARNDDFSFQFPTSFRLQYWDTATTSWKTRFTVEGETFAVTGEEHVYSADKLIDPDPARYWRVLGHESDNGSYLHIAELEMRTSIGGGSIAVELNAISGSNRTGFEDTKAFDGIVSGNNSWGIAYGSTTIDQRWVGQDFGSPRSIVEVQVTTRADTFEEQAPRVWQVQKSDDGVDWRTAWTNKWDEGAWVSSESRTSQLPSETDVLMLDFDDGTDGLQDAKDQSKGVTTLTWNGGAVVSSSVAIDGNALAVNLDAGTDDYVSIPAIDFGTSGDFTIECWIHSTAFDVTNFLSPLGNYNSAQAGSWGFYVRNGTTTNYLDFRVQGSTVMVGATDLEENRWYHAAVTRTGDTYRLFLNGILQDSYTQVGLSVYGSAAGAIRIGGNQNGTAERWQGYLDGVRINKGYSHYRTNDSFNPPENLLSKYSPQWENQTVIFALMGQSNMIGRNGPIDGIIDATDADILMYNVIGDNYITAADPLDHFGETANTVGPGLTFAKDFKAGQNPTRTLLVGMAQGTTGFIRGDYLPNRTGSFYEDIRDRWNAAYARAVATYGSVVVGGLLWMQGEDEAQNYASLFNTASEGRKSFGVMPATMMEIIRGGDFDGVVSDTPVVVGSIAPGSLITGTTQYTEIEAGIANIPNILNRSGAADGSDLSADTIHYLVADSRTMGNRLYTQWANALSNNVNYNVPTFVPDAGNVETAFAFSANGMANNSPVIMQAGTYPLFENKRVHVETGRFQFDSDAELRWSPGAVGRQSRPELSNRDFVFKCTLLTDVNVEQGIFSLYDTVSNRRSFVLRVNTGPVLQFYGSDAGTSATLMLTHSISLATEYDIEIRRVGTALTLHVDGVLQDSYVLSGGYSFYSPPDINTHIGDHINAREFNGYMESMSLEFLS